MAYIPLNRANNISSQQLANDLRDILLRVDDPLEVVKIISAEIASNDPSCQLNVLKSNANEHLINHGHCSTFSRGNQYNHQIISKFNMINTNLDTLKNTINEIFDLLFSWRASYSVGNLQGPFTRNEYGFVLYTNLNGHGIPNLGAISGTIDDLRNHITIPTNYLRVVFRFMDRLENERVSPLYANQQLILLTAFHENPYSLRLATSILPAGVDLTLPGLPILGHAVGAYPGTGANDNRIHKIIPPIVVPHVIPINSVQVNAPVIITVHIPIFLPQEIFILPTIILIQQE